MIYQDLMNSPTWLADLNLKAVWIPKQDGWRPHYALWSTVEDYPVFHTNDLQSLVEEAERRRVATSA